MAELWCHINYRSWDEWPPNYAIVETECWNTWISQRSKQCMQSWVNVTCFIEVVFIAIRWVLDYLDLTSTISVT